MPSKINVTYKPSWHFEFQETLKRKPALRVWALSTPATTPWYIRVWCHITKRETTALGGIVMQTNSPNHQSMDVRVDSQQDASQKHYINLHIFHPCLFRSPNKKICPKELTPSSWSTSSQRRRDEKNLLAPTMLRIPMYQFRHWWGMQAPEPSARRGTWHNHRSKKKLQKSVLGKLYEGLTERIQQDCSLALAADFARKCCKLFRAGNKSQDSEAMGCVHTDSCSFFT